MRIAMLSTIERRTPPLREGGREWNISLLTEGLVKRGIKVTLFATQDSLTSGSLEGVCPGPLEEDQGLNSEVWESLHIANLMEKADQFDLLHNHCGFLPLNYCHLVPTPMLTTIYGVPPLESLPVYKKYNGRTFYASIGDADRHPELDYIASIPYEIAPGGSNLDTPSDRFPREEMVGAYLKIYERILEGSTGYSRKGVRPWGSYIVLEDRNTYKVKRIEVLPGQRLSYQKHEKREEHWMVVRGQAVVTLGRKKISLIPGQAIDIPRRATHRVANAGPEILTFIEIQTGDYLGEDDIVRLQDDFGRV